MSTLNQTLCFKIKANDFYLMEIPLNIYSLLILIFLKTNIVLFAPALRSAQALYNIYTVYIVSIECQVQPFEQCIGVYCCRMAGCGNFGHHPRQILIRVCPVVSGIALLHRLPFAEVEEQMYFRDQLPHLHFGLQCILSQRCVNADELSSQCRHFCFGNRAHELGLRGQQVIKFAEELADR